MSIPFKASDLGLGSQGVLIKEDGQVEAAYAPVQERHLDNALIQKINGVGTSNGTWPVYADDASGLNASYEDDLSRTHYAIVSGTSQPDLATTEITRWIALNPTGGTAESGDPGVAI